MLRARMEIEAGGGLGQIWWEAEDEEGLFRQLTESHKRSWIAIDTALVLKECGYKNGYNQPNLGISRLSFSL